MVRGMVRAPADKNKVAQIRRILTKMGMKWELKKLANNKRFFRIMTEKNHTIEFGQAHGEILPHTYRDIVKEITSLFHKPILYIEDFDCTLSISDFWKIWLNFGAAVSSSISRNSDLYVFMKLRGEVIKSLDEIAVLTMYSAMNIVVIRHSSLDGAGLINFDFENSKIHPSGEFLRQRIMISLYKPKIRPVYIDGKKRKCYEAVFMPKFQYGYKTVSVTINGKRYPAYIQSHALRRIEERYDITSPSVAREIVFDAVNEKEAIPYQGTWLVPCNYKEHIVGYMLCEIIDDFCLFKTFLFVTQNGTPQGDYLLKSLDLTKKDKTLLTIDRFSAFKKSSIAGDPFLVELFKDNDLSYLLELDLEKVLIPTYVHERTSRYLKNYLIKRDVP